MGFTTVNFLNGATAVFSVGTKQVIPFPYWLVVDLPSEKYDFVSGDYDPQYMEKIKHVPNHLPALILNTSLETLETMVFRWDFPQNWAIPERTHNWVPKGVFFK